jgi:polysaccharide biosynthesis/export protein
VDIQILKYKQLPLVLYDSFSQPAEFLKTPPIMKTGSAIIGFLVVLSTFFSCKTTHPVAYMQSGADSSKPGAVKMIEPRVQKNDLLGIIIRSASLDPAVDAPYNYGGISATSGGANASGSAPGYLVDATGSINFPRLGSLRVEGMTKAELANMLQNRLKDSLLNPVADIRFLNYKITILGEVLRGGQYPITNEKVNILEALGMAGDITLFGKKENITVIREVNGIPTQGKIDLTKKDAYTSPYFYLQQNDIVIVDADVKKYKTADQLTARNISIVTSVISTVAFLITILRTR